jgi:hypothetical protein
MTPYSFGSSAKRMTAIRHMKEISRRGLNAASGSFPAGANVRIRNTRR